MRLSIVALSSLLLLVVAETEAASTGFAGGDDKWDIYHPLDEGLWQRRSNSNQKNGRDEYDVDDELQEEQDVVIDDKLLGLRNDLRMAEIDSIRLFSPLLSSDVMQPMTYSIFKSGRSALRTIMDQKKQPQQQQAGRHLLYPQTIFGLSSSATTTTTTTNDGNNNNEPSSSQQSSSSNCRPSHYRVCAILLLLRGYSDAAHEMLLGVTVDNLEQAEYAATHRGQTDWATKHPLDDTADLFHAALHRIVEGNAVGEGDETGFENAKYWLAGGPKLLPSPAPHPVRESLLRIARQHTPKCCASVIVRHPQGVQHRVLSGKGTYRTVTVECGSWDDFAFLELCQQWADGSLANIDKDLEDEVATLQRAEIILLLRHELMDCLRGTTSSATSSSGTGSSISATTTARGKTTTRRSKKIDDDSPSQHKRNVGGMILNFYNK